MKEEDDLREPLSILRGEDVELHLGGHIDEDFKDVDLIIKNPAVPDNSPFLEIARKNGVQIEMGSGVFFQEADMSKIIGVTGTKGKSTTTALIYEVLKDSVPDMYKAGDVKRSPLHFLKYNKEGKMGVIELSSWRLEGVKPHKKSPHIAVITSIAQDHLNRYESYDKYKEAKKIIVDFQDENDYAFFHYESEYLHKIAPEVKSKIIWFSGEQKPEPSVGEVGCYIKDGIIHINNEEYEYKEEEFRALHHPSNISATLSIAYFFDVPISEALENIKSFGGLFGRLQIVAEKDGIKWYNDTAATNPYATSQSINAVGKDDLALIVGGEDKEMEFDVLVENMVDVPFIFVLPGSASDKISKENERYGCELISVNDLREAVEKARDSGAKKVLFSPGSASFNMFKNEFDRGEKFIECVNSI